MHIERIDLLTKTLNLFTHVCFPEVCPVCGRLATPGCISCFADQIAPLMPRCSLCGALYPCSRHPYSFPVYSGNVRQYFPRKLVLELKYKNNPQIGMVMGRALALSLIQIDCDYLVPVPLHKGSKRKYNQAFLIARGLGQVWDKDVKDILKWNYRVVNQSGKKNTNEKRSLEKGSIRAKGNCGGSSVVLVDDVITTGSTLSRCKESLAESSITVKAAVTWTAAIHM